MAVDAEVDDVRRQYLALIDLADAARHEPDPTVRTWSERAIWQESKAFLGADDEQHEFPPDRYERAQQSLYAAGFKTCPRCLAPLASDADFARWRRMRQAHIEELQLREKAIEG
jgi:hypothetical protein